MQQRAPRQCRGALFVVVPVYPAETFLTPCQAAWESCQRRGPLNVSLSVLRAGYAPQAYFSCAGKVGKSAPAPPLFVQSVGIEADTQLPLKFRWVADPLVIGAVDIQLRLSPLGLRGASFLLTRTCAVSRKAQEVPQRTPASPVPSKGHQAKLDKIPAGDQMPAAEFQRLRTVKT